MKTAVIRGETEGMAGVERVGQGVLLDPGRCRVKGRRLCQICI